MALASDDFEAHQPRDPTMVLPLEDSASPAKSDETLILTDIELPNTEASPTPALPDETMAVAIDESEAQQPSDPTMVLPLEDCKSRSQSDETLIFTDVELPNVEDTRSAARRESGARLVPPADHSPTQQLEVDELGLPFEESPTLAERFRLLESQDLESDSRVPSASDEPHAPDAADVQHGDMHQSPMGGIHDESDDGSDDASRGERSWIGNFRRKRNVR
jgi:hypothetical protein